MEGQTTFVRVDIGLRCFLQNVGLLGVVSLSARKFLTEKELPNPDDSWLS